MTKHHPENEKIKHRYLHYLRAAKGMSEASIDVVVKALHRFEQITNFRDFRRFHIEQAIAFRTELVQRTTAAHGKPLSRSTVLSTLNALRSFFLWLADQQGYRSRIRYADAEYFKLSEKETRVAQATRERPVPTLEQMHFLLSSMPAGTDVERRDRAIVALVLLTGIRDGALITLKMKHLDLSQGRVIQDPREVGTKFSKSILTWFYPVGGQAREIVQEYAQTLLTEGLRGNDDPLFPSTKVVINDDAEFARGGLSRHHWQNARPVRDIFRCAGAAVGLPYFNPHSVRNTLVQLGFRLCGTLEEMKAWSQNMGHSHMMTTLTSYGEIPAWRQGELIQGLNNRGSDDPKLAREAAAFIRRIRGYQNAAEAPLLGR